MAATEHNFYLAPGVELSHAGVKYVIEKGLSSGGFSLTYLARDTRPGGKNVLIKEYFPSEACARSSDGVNVVPAGSRSALYGGDMNAFLNEARRLSEINTAHPNIVQAFDCFRANNTAYLVLEYVEGKTLYRYINEQGRGLSETEVLRLITPILEALVFMHEKLRLFHLDLKPENVLIESRTGRVVLVDFGCARHFDCNGQPTFRDILTGYSPGYSAPEAMSQTFDRTSSINATAVDVYGTGAVLFSLITGQNPPEKPSRAVLKAYFDDAEKWMKPYMTAIIAALSLKPEKRPKSVHGFARMIGVEVEYAEKPVQRVPTKLTPEEVAAVTTLGRKVKPGGTQKMVVKSTRRVMPRKSRTVAFNFRKLLMPALGVLAAAVLIFGVWMLVNNLRSGEIEPVGNSGVAERIDDARERNEAERQRAEEIHRKLGAAPSSSHIASSRRATQDESQSQFTSTRSVFDGTNGGSRGEEQIPASPELLSGTEFDRKAALRGGNIWKGSFTPEGYPDGRGVLHINAPTAYGGSIIPAGSVIEEALFENGELVSGTVRDGSGKYLFTIIN